MTLNPQGSCVDRMKMTCTPVQLLFHLVGFKELAFLIGVLDLSNLDTRSCISKDKSMRVSFRSASKRALVGYSYTSSSLTPSACATTCSSKGYSIAGVEYGQECYCSNSIVTSSSPSSGQSANAGDCNMACAGDSTQKCGAGNRLQIFRRSNLPSGWSSLGCYTDSTTSRYVHLLGALCVTATIF
jgi:hypothetical protein